MSTKKNPNRRQDGEAYYIQQREGRRRIKLHDEELQQRKARSKMDAVVLTEAGLPDMRFAEDKLLFQPDPSKRLDGEPDKRFVENRPDLLAVHKQRGTTRRNFIFTDDMKESEDGD